MQLLPDMIHRAKAVLLDIASQRQMLWSQPAVQEALRQQKVEPIQKYTHQIRWIKSPSEVERMREAAAITCQVCTDSLCWVCGLRVSLEKMNEVVLFCTCLHFTSDPLWLTGFVVIRDSGKRGS